MSERKTLQRTLDVMVDFCLAASKAAGSSLASLYFPSDMSPEEKKLVFNTAANVGQSPLALESKSLDVAIDGVARIVDDIISISERCDFDNIKMCGYLETVGGDVLDLIRTKSRKLAFLIDDRRPLFS